MTRGLFTRVLLGALAVFGTAVAAARASTFFHEVAGHLGAGALTGGRPSWLQVTLMGGGSANCAWKTAPGPWGEAAFHLGGLAFNAVAGAACLVALAIRRRAPAGGPVDLGVRVFGALSIFAAIHYTVAGSYYGWGDPHEYPWLWKPAIALALPAFVLALRPAGAWVAARVADDDAGCAARVGVFLAVAGLAAGGYGGLYQALKQREFAAFQARGEAERRATEAARDEKLAKIARERADDAAAREARGEPVPEELKRAPRREDVTVAPEEVKKPFPIEIPLGACYLLAAILAAAARPRVPGREVGFAEAAAGLFVGALALLAMWPLAHGARLGS